MTDRLVPLSVPEYTVARARTAGWFRFHPEEGLVRVDKDTDPVVQMAKAADKNFLLGRDFAAESTDVLRTQISQLFDEQTRLQQKLAQTEAQLAQKASQLDALKMEPASISADEVKRLQLAEIDLTRQVHDLTVAKEALATEIESLKSDLETSRAYGADRVVAYRELEEKLANTAPDQLKQRDDRIKELEAQLAGTAGYADQLKQKDELLKQRDDRIAQLEAAPRAAVLPAASGRSSLMGFWTNQRPLVRRGSIAAVLAILFLGAYLGYKLNDLVTYWGGSSTTQVVTNTQAPPAPAPTPVAANCDAIQNDLTTTKATLAARENELGTTKATLASKTEEAKNLQSQVDAKNRELAAKNNQLSEKDRAVPKEGESVASKTDSAKDPSRIPDAFAQLQAGNTVPPEAPAAQCSRLPGTVWVASINGCVRRVK